MPITINSIEVADRSPSISAESQRFNVAYTASLPLGNLTWFLRLPSGNRWERRNIVSLISAQRPGRETRWSGIISPVSGGAWQNLQPVTRYDVSASFSPTSYFTSVVVSLPGDISQTVTTSFTTTRNLRLRIDSQTFNRDRGETTFNIRPSYSGTAYYRYGRVGDLDESGLITVTSGAVSRLTLREIFPDRDYEFQISEFADYDPALIRNWRQPNLEILGIINPALTFDRTVNFWRSALGLQSFSLITGELPAGYIQSKHTNIEELPDELNDIVTYGKTIVAADLGRQLARRTVAGSFEQGDGSWKLVSKSLWDDQPVLYRFTKDRFRITSRTIRADIRDRLAISEVSVQIFVGNERNATGDETQQTRVDVVPGLDASDSGLIRTKIAQNIRRELDLTQLFTYIQQIPGWSRENVALIAEDTPRILIVDIAAQLDPGVSSRELHAAQPSDRISVELSHGDGTAIYTGTLITRRVHGAVADSGALYHRFTIWVDTIELLNRISLFWDQGNWDEGIWAE